jgi:hypothetical protein
MKKLIIPAALALLMAAAVRLPRAATEQTGAPVETAAAGRR